MPQQNVSEQNGIEQQNGVEKRTSQRGEPRATQASSQETQPSTNDTGNDAVEKDIETEISSPSPQPEQRQEPPGRTPDTPPPLATPETEPTPQPSATPTSEAKPVPPSAETTDADVEPERTVSDSLYGEDLPPDFWDSDPVAEAHVATTTQNEPRPDEVAFDPSSHSPPRQVARQEVVGKLEDDPRFTVMQSLFPGQIVEWKESEEVETGENVDGLEGADDANGEVDGVDLETDA